MLRYKSSWEFPIILTTAGYIIGNLLFVIIYYFVLPSGADIVFKIVANIIPLWFLFVVTLSFAHNCGEYLLNSGELVLQKAYGQVVIPLNDITSVQSIGREPLMPIFGSPGIFGWSGTYRSSDSGKVKIYAHNAKHRILIDTQTNGKIIISPDDPLLIEELKKSISKT